jgi:hypothetical protein
VRIDSGFDDEHPREYTVEEYDPKTHELKDKKGVMSAALDYGTVGISGRVPARGRAATAGEWFTLTVVADGRHVATWVNGVQQVDWTDNRPPSDDAREGCRLGRGSIGLRGHDPATDIDCRNVRVADLSGAAE